MCEIVRREIDENWADAGVVEQDGEDCGEVVINPKNG